jgi:hypothetical protein
MAYVDWMIRTKQLGTCSCDYGCPCEFNAPPTRLPCEGVMALEITEGYFGDVRLDGLRIAGVYHWPGPMHEGDGTWWSIIDFLVVKNRNQLPVSRFMVQPLRTNLTRCLQKLISNGTWKGFPADLWLKGY